MIEHIDHLNLSVRNFNESANWYAEVFRFEVLERVQQDGKPWGGREWKQMMRCFVSMSTLYLSYPQATRDAQWEITDLVTLPLKFGAKKFF